MWRAFVIFALSASTVIGLLAIGITVRSIFVTDNASWHRRRIHPLSAAPAEYRRQWAETGCWAELSDWYWLSERGILEFGFSRSNALRSNDDFSHFHYGPGFNYWRFDEPVGWRELPPEAWGHRYVGIGWYERNDPVDAANPVWVPAHKVRFIRLPLLLIALVTLLWPGSRALAWLRRRQRGFPVVTDVAPPVPGNGASRKADDPFAPAGGSSDKAAGPFDDGGVPFALEGRPFDKADVPPAPADG